MKKRLFLVLSVMLAILSILTWQPLNAEAKNYKFPAGDWQLNANNFKGVLHLAPGYNPETAATHYGTIFGERITPITFNRSTGEIKFFRPNVGQEYVGKVDGNQITGTFSHQGKIYMWRAWR
ncbi:hypothetical protein QUF75_12405 [Desulfococcaceae bacterium HSG7]|nr:hypothetical protein [Desulfococcaceae bacterium HSG7]